MATPPGKTVGQRTYLHIEAASALTVAETAGLLDAERLAGVQRAEHYNLIRMDADGSQIALLNYPEFFDQPFPALRESWRVNLAAGTISYRSYAGSLNPPILHRKELLLPDDHPRRTEYAALTAAAESIGLFDQPTRIGYQRQWLALVQERGYRIAGHSLLPLGNDQTSGDESPRDPLLPAGWQAARHLTALVRYNFSAPVQTLARYGFLDGQFSLFDYGCGRGDDLRGLRENGLNVAGWDPYYAPDQPLQIADLVNLGFVINVIEDHDERLEALIRAWSLAERLLVVAVMLANQNDPRGEDFRDGVLTQRGTFQKYYSQTEIKTFIAAALDQEPIPVAPGVLYVFRDPEVEQRFLLDQCRSRRNRLALPSTRERPVPPLRDRAAERYAQYQQPLEQLWNRYLSLGRRPDLSEIADPLPLIEGFGSLNRAFRFLEIRQEPAELAQARHSRIADLEVYFALTRFERRKPYTHLERGLQRDIKAFFGDYPTAQAAAQERLFQIADPDALAQACQFAAERGLGKIHMASGKVSLLRYTDFENQPLPRMIERVKIKLREQRIDYFAYGDRYEPPFLYHKSRYINEEFPHYPEQRAFEAALDQVERFDWAGYGPSPGELLNTLAQQRRMVEGFALNRSTTIPALDDPCGRYLSFRQLIECGETQAETGLANLPREPESYNALLDLALNVLDPVIDYFGMIRLSYGFCSLPLARRIPGRIDSKRDQHAAHEVNRQGRPVCVRRGAAVDFIVEDENMLEVAQWIVANTPFDRLYFYAEGLPVHVSFGPNHDSQVVRMITAPSGRLVPQVMSGERFLAVEPSPGSAPAGPISGPPPG
ncbi:MAG: DNA phosphorothioation-associated putative methyltransferase [Candidatus Contendobacter sp.]|nr:DNA phosphorothioation-associated putative methyltransferase [Candidatus Contendobacter sp.]